MTYVYAGAADWGGKDPAKCNRGLYRLATEVVLSMSCCSSGEIVVTNEQLDGTNMIGEFLGK